MRRDEVRRLRASSQRGTRAALELPPGPLGVPARSWLTDRSAHSSATDRTKAGPVAGKTLVDWRAAEGARVPQGTSHKDFALFGAPSPLTPRTRHASRQGARMSVLPACNCPGPRQSLHSHRDQQPGRPLLGNAVRQYLPARQRDGPLCRLRSYARGDRRLGGDERCGAARRHGCPAHADRAARRSKRLDA